MCVYVCVCAFFFIYLVLCVRLQVRIAALEASLASERELSGQLQQQVSGRMMLGIESSPPVLCL